MVLWRVQNVLLLIKYPLLCFSKPELENSNIVREVPVTCYRLPGLCWTWGSFPVCHERWKKLCLGFFFLIPTCFSSDLQSSHSWHGNVWDNVWPQITKEKTNSVCKWCAGSSGECWGLVRVLWPGQGQRPGDRGHWCKVTRKEKWFVLYMYEKPALFLKKYLVPPSMLLLCEEEGKGDQLNWGF